LLQCHTPPPLVVTHTPEAQGGAESFGVLADDNGPVLQFAPGIVITLRIAIEMDVENANFWSSLSLF
jgi:hypothetical protein